MMQHDEVDDTDAVGAEISSHTIASLRARVASLPASKRQRLLINAASRPFHPLQSRSLLHMQSLYPCRIQGIDTANLASEPAVQDTDWGFATGVPTLEQLLQHHESHASNPAAPAGGRLADLLEPRRYWHHQRASYTKGLCYVS